MSYSDIPKIVITGGPCSGKTTFLSQIGEDLLSKGIHPFFVPEAATMVIQGGVSPSLVSPPFFQRKIAQLQKYNEDFFNSLAEHSNLEKDLRKVILCDRGVLDGAAYVNSIEGSLVYFQRSILLDEIHGIGLGVEEVRARYEGVIHLTTAANGAEEFYTLANNSARTETLEEARILDEKIKEAWLGHGHISVVSNIQDGESISFEEKKRIAREKIFSILGIPVPIEIEDKYILRDFDPGIIPVSYQKIGISQTYLNPVDFGWEERVRERSWHGYRSYYHTKKRKDSRSGGRFEVERTVSLKEYLNLLERSDPSRDAILKDRYCFLFGDQYFEVDQMLGRHLGKYYLEREKTSINESTQLPDFLHIERQVTGDPLHSMGHLSLIN
ncbi:AAA family ATPase [Candidatus Parcubacteria bacterium]|nr:AAA family ATPase [Candidatus Parcubacteria bacterium]